MANIGTFTKTSDGYKGEIVTMSVQQKNVRIVSEPDGANENAPSHRVFVGRVNICLGSSFLSNEGRSCLEAERSDLVTESAIAVIAGRQFPSMSGCACSCAAHCRSSSPPGSAGRGQAA